MVHEKDLKRLEKLVDKKLEKAKEVRLGKEESEKKRGSSKGKE